MKRSIATLCVLSLLGGLLVIAGAGLSLSASPPKATGGVAFTTIEGGTEVQRKIEFNAHATDPAKGNLNYRDSNGDWFRVDIQCVTVVGKRAFFSGPITSGSQDEWADQWLLVIVFDGGTPGRKGDLVWGEMYDSDPGCEPQPFPDKPWPVENGNLVVH
ncbi:MAG: hypothetical protein AMJ73_04465 [candidate division Zixibacteria bacterium SM1_73]|nr:MAG: hypothetical protein AMJ73_04465 [candidate division Zixibacteria bacterium SM1_73]